MAKRTIAIGVFKYDQYPYFVIQKIIGYEDDGRVITDIGVYKRSALIIAYPPKKKDELERLVTQARGKYRIGQKELRFSIADEVFENFPELKMEAKKD